MRADMGRRGMPLGRGKRRERGGGEKKEGWWGVEEREKAYGGGEWLQREKKADWDKPDRVSRSYLN